MPLVADGDSVRLYGIFYRAGQRDHPSVAGVFRSGLARVRLRVALVYDTTGCLYGGDGGRAILSPAKGASPD